MNLNSKKVLSIDLTKKTYNTKGYTDLEDYVGGAGIGFKLLQNHLDENPIIFAVGPLTGYFPYASKTAVVLEDSGVVEDIYIGGTLGSRIKFAGLDAIMITGKAAEDTHLDIREYQAYFKKEESPGLPGKNSTLSFAKKDLRVDNYFSAPEDFLEKKFSQKNLKSLTITATEIYKPKNFENYRQTYYEILNKANELTVKEGNFPSCYGCPRSCAKSKEGEIGGNVLLHSLVACEFAENIYSDIGIVFSCLNVLGYHYTHEDIENLPSLIEEVLKRPK
jgi:aldehyde:ferredoxin oxidoreductase